MTNRSGRRARHKRHKARIRLGPAGIRGPSGKRTLAEHAWWHSDPRRIEALARWETAKFGRTRMWNMGSLMSVFADASCLLAEMPMTRTP